MLLSLARSTRTMVPTYLLANVAAPHLCLEFVTQNCRGRRTNGQCWIQAAPPCAPVTLLVHCFCCSATYSSIARLANLDRIRTKSDACTLMLSGRRLPFGNRHRCPIPSNYRIEKLASASDGDVADYQLAYHVEHAAHSTAWRPHAADWTMSGVFRLE